MRGISDASGDLDRLSAMALKRSADAVLWLDASGRVLHANEAACRGFGLSAQDFTRISFFDIDAHCDAVQWPGLRQLLKNKPEEPYATEFRTRKGARLPVEITCAAFDSKGMAVLVLFARDVSLCKRSEESSRKDEARLRAIGMALPDLVFLLDEHGRHLEVLTSRENLLYLPSKQIKGRLLHEIFERPLADRFLNLVKETLSTNRPGVIEYELRIDGKSHYFEARTAPLNQRIEDKNCLVWIARDITERIRAEHLQSQNIYLQEELTEQLNYGEILGASPAMASVFENIKMVAKTDATVLLLGETGTGKELIARAIHKTSRRGTSPLIKVNCGALSLHLAESELFGHEKGAFTGAVERKKGRFELAHQGTIFLDEVGELSPQVQIKLLRVLQEQEFERVGGSRTMKVDVRVIAATNRDLSQLVKDGGFRPDLYYRLNIFPISVPPLRDRKEDIPLLARHFVAVFSERFNKGITDISEQALAKLIHANWPGNVRELANILERGVILCRGRILEQKHLSGLHEAQLPADHFMTLEQMERRHIQAALARTGGVQAGPKGAAALLDINRSTLWSRMRKLGIRVEKTVHS